MFDDVHCNNINELIQVYTFEIFTDTFDMFLELSIVLLPTIILIYE